MHFDGCFLGKLLFPALEVHNRELRVQILASAFNLRTHGFNLETCAFSLLTRGFELVTCRLELADFNS